MTATKPKFTESEKKILAQIRKSMRDYTGKYDFWFVYDDEDNAINWEGGCELGQSMKFRNQYTVEAGKQIKKNWE